MRNNHNPIRFQLILYLLTFIALSYSGYLHLNFGARGIENLSLSDLINGWPIIILICANLLYIVSLVKVFKNSYQAAKSAILAGLIGLFYFVLAGCILLYLWFLPVSTMPNKLMFFAPSMTLLVLTIIYSFRIIKLDNIRKPHG